ncbi:MAG: hypothetical protein SVM79_05755 [Chloroflexota bacterium]|nr:hypothetical protein [Chloroflexota bacterium]
MIGTMRVIMDLGHLERRQITAPRMAYSQIEAKSVGMALFAPIEKRVNSAVIREII